MTRKFEFIVPLAIAAAVGSVLLIPSGQLRLWIGGFNLTLHLRSSDHHSIRRVEYDDVRREPGRDDVHGYEWDSLKDALQVNDSSFLARVQCIGSDDGWGRSLSYSEFDLVLLRVTFDDDTVVETLVDIPKGRGPREVMVVLP